MPLFQYKALNTSDEVLEGQIEAVDEAAVISKLQDMGYFPVSTQLALAERQLQKNKHISSSDILLFTQNLSVSIKAGLTLDVALLMLSDTTESKPLQKLLENVIAAVQNGVALSDALQQHSVSFDRFYINTLRAGETAGGLDIVLSRLADYLQRSQKTKKTIQSALVYPAVLVAVACITLLILLVYVVPQFQLLFEDMGQAVPLPTQIVIAVADFIKHYFVFVLIGAFVAYRLLKQRLNDDAKRESIDKWVLKLPLIADMVLKLQVTRFSRSMSTLLSNGVPMLTALNVVADSVSNIIIRKGLHKLKNEVQQGKRLAAGLKTHTAFPPLAIQLIKVGEDTGELTTMLEQVADIYDDELQQSVQRFLTLLEPILIIGLGIIIAGIIISVLLAIMSLNDFAV